MKQRPKRSEDKYWDQPISNFKTSSFEKDMEVHIDYVEKENKKKDERIEELESLLEIERSHKNKGKGF